MDPFPVASSSRTKTHLKIASLRAPAGASAPSSAMPGPHGIRARRRGHEILVARRRDVLRQTFAVARSHRRLRSTLGRMEFSVALGPRAANRPGRGGGIVRTGEAHGRGLALRGAHSLRQRRRAMDHRARAHGRVTRRAQAVHLGSAVDVTGRQLAEIDGTHGGLVRARRSPRWANSSRLAARAIRALSLDGRIAVSSECARALHLPTIRAGARGIDRGGIGPTGGRPFRRRAVAPRSAGLEGERGRNFLGGNAISKV